MSTVFPEYGNTRTRARVRAQKSTRKLARCTRGGRGRLNSQRRFNARRFVRQQFAQLSYEERFTRILAADESRRACTRTHAEYPRGPPAG